MRRLRACLLIMASWQCPLAGFAQPAPQYVAIEAAEFQVPDVARSVAFYVGLFGDEVWRDAEGKHFIVLGNSVLQLQGAATAEASALAFAVNPYEAPALQGFLAGQGLNVQAEGANLAVEDRDGIHARLVAADAWPLARSNLQRVALTQAGAAPVFEPLAIDEVFLTVTNLEVDSLFYARLLNRNGTLQAGSLWFRIGEHARLRLTQTPPGQVSGVNYVAIQVANTDMEAAAEAVFAAGGIIETILPNGFSFWDPDGIRVLVRSGDLY